MSNDDYYRYVQELRRKKQLYDSNPENQLNALIKKRAEWSQALGEVDEGLMKRKSKGDDSMAFQLILDEMSLIDVKMEKIIAVMKQYKEYANFKFPACGLAHITDFPDPTEAVE